MATFSTFVRLSVGDRFRFPADQADAICTKVSRSGYRVEKSNDSHAVGLTHYTALTVVVVPMPETGRGNRT